MSSYWVRSLLLILGEHILIIAHHAESLCDNKEIIESNIRSVKISSPDVRFFLIYQERAIFIHLQYKNWDPDKAVEDYYTRIKGHEKYYQTLEERTWPWIKIINVSPITFSGSFSIYLSILGRREDYFERKGPFSCISLDDDNDLTLVQNIQGYLQVGVFTLELNMI